jgi:hypothetical protein
MGNSEMVKVSIILDFVDFVIVVPATGIIEDCVGARSEAYPMKPGNL